MAATVGELRAWIVQQMTCTPQRALITCYVGTLSFLAAVFWIIPRTPLEGPVGGVVGVLAITACCWRAGLGPSLLIPILIVVMSRLPINGPPKPWMLTSSEFLAFVAVTILTGTVGLAGTYRRRFRAATLCHEARIRQHLRAMSQARILFRDLDGRITTWTEGVEQLFGWTSAEAAGRSVHELLQSRFPQPLEDIQQELLRNHQWHGEVIQKCKDGRELIVATHWIFYRGESGERDGVAEVHNDITALRQAEAAVRESERRKDLFIATLAHELRNPLAPIRNGLECIRLRKDKPPDPTMFAVVERQLEHMVRLVDDLLDVSRINTGKIELRRTLVELRQIVDDSIAASRSPLDAARHVLTVNLPDESIHLNADPARLTQVLTNLLHNAGKFTDPGGRISLTAVCSHQQVEIRIKDSGIGIAPESICRVFDVFAQVQDVRTRTQGGLGLGLSIVKSLIAMHGGTVEVHSDGLGLGTEFIVRLPTVASHLVSTAGAAVAANPTSLTTKAPRVLVVDDNQDAARTMAMALDMIGCTCQTAFSGPAALKLAETFQPDTFVLDLGMPGMSGLELAKCLRSQNKFQNALLIAVTGWDSEEDRRVSKAAGFDHHFAKPVDLAVLMDLLQPDYIATT